MNIPKAINYTTTTKPHIITVNPFLIASSKAENIFQYKFYCYIGQIMFYGPIEIIITPIDNITILISPSPIDTSKFWDKKDLYIRVIALNRINLGYNGNIILVKKDLTDSFISEVE